MRLGSREERTNGVKAYGSRASMERPNYENIYENSRNSITYKKGGVVGQQKGTLQSIE